MRTRLRRPPLPVLKRDPDGPCLERAVGKAWPRAWPQRPCLLLGPLAGWPEAAQMQRRILGFGPHRAGAVLSFLFLFSLIYYGIQRARDMCVRWDSHLERAPSI